MDKVKNMKEMKTSFASLERKMKWEPNRAVLDAVKVREGVDEQPKASGLDEISNPTIRKPINHIGVEAHDSNCHASTKKAR
ncbi:hypothetical protein V6N11_082977 [Hibiscus sabdariffa]|uniref:Uncharacterized protein n=1 Tax=Hibiscus sabdariffa TaxID=183260 RepID=A0ABR2QKN0_9ROSI